MMNLKFHTNRRHSSDNLKKEISFKIIKYMIYKYNNQILRYVNYDLSQKSVSNWLKISLFKKCLCLFGEL